MILAMILALCFWPCFGNVFAKHDQETWPVYRKHGRQHGQGAENMTNGALSMFWSCFRHVLIMFCWSCFWPCFRRLWQCFPGEVATKNMATNMATNMTNHVFRRLAMFCRSCFVVMFWLCPLRPFQFPTMLTCALHCQLDFALQGTSYRNIIRRSR